MNKWCRVKYCSEVNMFFIVTCNRRHVLHRVWRQNYMDSLLQELVTKRKQLLDAAVKTPPDAPITLPPAKKKVLNSLRHFLDRKQLIFFL